MGWDSTRLPAQISKHHSEGAPVSKHRGWARASKPVLYPSSSGLYYSGWIVRSLFLMHSTAEYFGTVYDKQSTGANLCSARVIPVRAEDSILGSRQMSKEETRSSHTVWKLVKPRLDIETSIFCHLHYM